MRRILSLGLPTIALAAAVMLTACGVSGEPSDLSDITAPDNVAKFMTTDAPQACTLATAKQVQGIIGIKKKLTASSYVGVTNNPKRYAPQSRCVISSEDLMDPHVTISTGAEQPHSHVVFNYITKHLRYHETTTPYANVDGYNQTLTLADLKVLSTANAYLYNGRLTGIVFQCGTVTVATKVDVLINTDETPDYWNRAMTKRVNKLAKVELNNPQLSSCDGK